MLFVDRFFIESSLKLLNICFAAVLLPVIFQSMSNASDGALFKGSQNSKGYRLENHTLDSLTTSSVLDCCLYCLRSSCCLSINYREPISITMEENCELNNASASASPEDLFEDELFSYYEIIDPHKIINFCCSTLCQNGGTCDFVNSECQCHPGYMGKTCNVRRETDQQYIPKSCKEIKSHYPNSTSAKYWIQVQSGSPLQVFCDMETDGGGWTLVYSYTFTNYENFYDVTNAVTPRPSWPVGYSDVRISEETPLNESSLGAMKFSLWSSIGSEFFIKSSVNDWIVCEANGGSIVVKQNGPLTCRNIKNVATACEGIAPNAIAWRSCGPRIYSNTGFYRFDGSMLHCFPTHNPCDKGSTTNTQEEVVYPGGAIFLR